MELLDRYLFAVGRYLPKDRGADILAELRANILSMAEDREQELGRPLNLDEEEAILKQHGHPMLVAARYMPRQYLIGPTIFPFYWHLIKTAFPWVVLLYALAHGVRFLFEPVTMQAIVDAVLGFFPVAFYMAGWVTIVFAVMEYARENYIQNSKVLYAWSPRNLPRAEPEPAGGRKTHPIFDFVGTLLGLVFLLVLRKHPFLVLGPGVVFLNTFRPAAVWITVYNLAIAFASIQLVIKFIAIFSRTVRSWRVWVDLATKASAIVIITWLVRAHEYVALNAGADAAKFQQAVDGINQALTIGFRVVIVILCAQLLWEVGKQIFPRLHVFARPSRFIV